MARRTIIIEGQVPTEPEPRQVIDVAEDLNPVRVADDTLRHFLSVDWGLHYNHAYEIRRLGEEITRKVSDELLQKICKGVGLPPHLFNGGITFSSLDVHQRQFERAMLGNRRHVATCSTHDFDRNGCCRNCGVRDLDAVAVPPRT